MDSAGGGMKLARDNEYQAVLPVRGKILNCWKAGLDKVLANAEVRDMINAFGLDIDPKTAKVTFNEANLRYGKIIISADADVDGAHIQSLFYTFIWHFAPELIEKGYIYATVPPLYKVTKGKQYHYLQDDAALESFKAQHPNSALVVNRLKGLGEMDADELEMSLLSPKTRTLKQVSSESSAQSTDLFEQLMGTAVGYRKKFIEEHSQEVEINV